MEIVIKCCSGCGITKSIEEFNYKDKRKAQLHSRCKSCNRLASKKHYEANKKYYFEKAERRDKSVEEQQIKLVFDYLSSHPCVDCGEKDIVCLTFDHVRGKKRGSVANLIGTCSQATLEAEIAKCEVRCANCHRIRTAKQFGYWRSLID